MSNQKPEQKPNQESIHVRQPTAMLSDLTSELLWPRILRAPSLALSPSRLFAGAICAFLMSVVVHLASWAAGSSSAQADGQSADTMEQMGNRVAMSFGRIIDAVLSLDAQLLMARVWELAIVLRTMVFESPVLAISIGLPMVVLLAGFGGAISRSTAIEFSQGRYATREDTFGFALRRIGQFIGAVIGPVVGCAIVFLIIAIGGLLLSVPVFDVIGSLAYGVALIIGGLATIVLLLHIVALPMIVPALAVEGTDSFDAIQRSYAYVIGKPLRYMLFSLILLLVGVLAMSVFTIVANGTMEMTYWAASMFANDSTQRVLSGEGELGATKNTAHQIIAFWHTLVQLGIAGYAISLFFTSSTLLYLVTRRVCDGQDINEVWNGIGE